MLFLDEIRLKVTDGKQDFTTLTAELENVDLFMAVSPWSSDGTRGKHEFVPPESPRILARQLYGRHRNSAQIQHLNMHRIGEQRTDRNGRDGQHTTPHADAATHTMAVAAT